jgi:hypothetical protein
MMFDPPRIASRSRHARSSARGTLVWALALVLSASPVPAQQPEPSLGLELNTVADLSGSCRLTFVADNGTGTDIGDLQFEMAVFDTGGIARLVTFEFGALRDGRIRVLQFDLPDQGCAGVSMLHVNKVVSCQAGGQPSELCDAALRASSRVGAVQVRM